VSKEESVRRREKPKRSKVGKNRRKCERTAPTYKVRSEHRQNHRRELPLPVRVAVVLHREQQRREAGSDATEDDEELGRDAGGGDGDDDLRVEMVRRKESKKEVKKRRGRRTLRTRPVIEEGRKRTVARTGSRFM
jgi:hypothetical protein